MFVSISLSLKDHAGIKFRTNPTTMFVILAAGIGGYHLWRHQMIARFGCAAKVEHPYLCAAALAAACATEIEMWW